MMVPAFWLQDQAVVLARANRFSESTQPRELGMAPRRRRDPSTLPDAAFGPPERSGDNTENVRAYLVDCRGGSMLRATALQFLTTPLPQITSQPPPLFS